MPVFNPILVNVQTTSAEPSISAEPPDPVEVYKRTRPADWLPMPEPTENEMYLLVHILDGFSTLLAFTATSNGDYTVTVGSESTAMASGTTYETELFADNYGNLTSDGMKQVIIKISGEILTWKPATHSRKPSPFGFIKWPIKEISCNLPNATSVKCDMLSGLRYFTMPGTNQITNMNYMFQYCYSLCCIPKLNTDNVTTMLNMFDECFSLLSIPALNTSNVTGARNMFKSCFSLTGIPEIDISQVDNTSNMFANCYSLRTVPTLNIPEASWTSGMFANCSSLVTVPAINASKAYMADGMFSYCHSLVNVAELKTSGSCNMDGIFTKCSALTSVILCSSTGGLYSYDISLADCSLGKTALETLIQNMPSTTSQKLTLTGNPGVSELTDEIKAVASSKGWTLVL